MAEMTEKQWLSGVQSSIIKELTTHKAALPAGFNQERFALNTVTVISEMLKDKKKKTELCKLTFESMAVCLCKAAYLGLDYFNGECYAIPYGGELNFQTDYKGEIKMCKRFSRNPIKDIFAKVVREDDFFTEEVDAGIQNVIYRPQPFSNKPMIGAFAIVVFKDGSMMYDTMSVEEIENVRNTYSKAKDSQAWKSSTGEMYKKTVLRRLCKLIDLDFDNISLIEPRKIIFRRYEDAKNKSRIHSRCSGGTENRCCRRYCTGTGRRAKSSGRIRVHNRGTCRRGRKHFQSPKRMCCCGIKSRRSNNVYSV